MKTVVRLMAILIGLGVIGVTAAIAYIALALPDVGPAPDLKIKSTPQLIARGRYLANHVMLCMDCHAERDFSLYAGPPRPGTLGAGGEVFDRSMGLPGRFVSRNLTPARLADWSDGELFRAITSGVTRDGSALFPIMPYKQYAQIDPRDIHAVIAYLRSLPPVDNALEPSSADFPVSLLINTMPVKPSFRSRPDPADRIAYGEYLATAAACAECHTRALRGKPVGEYLAGGFEFRMPDGAIIRSANLTPHATGLGAWTKAQFIARFQAFKNTPPSPRAAHQAQTTMPWYMYAHMHESDLGAIFDYLQTLPAVDNRVTVFSPPGP